MNSDFVVPIPPSYNQNEEMMLGDVETYVKFLENSNVSTVMTTAGTSQYNLLSDDEIMSLNYQVSLFSSQC